MTQQPQQDSSTVVTVSLKKYDNQSGQYKDYMTLEVDREWMGNASGGFLLQRTEVEGFYQYQWALFGQTWTFYSISPALFDHLKL